MKKQIFLLLGALGLSIATMAETIEVKSVRHAGPFAVQSPYLVDSVDVNSKPFAMTNLLDTPFSESVLEQGTQFSGTILPTVEEGHALSMMQFAIENTSYAKAKINVGGLKNYKLFVDGQKHSGSELTLEPATHSVVIKYLSEAGVADTLNITIESDDKIALREDGKRLYTIMDVLNNERFGGIQLSPSGDYLIATQRTSMKEGRSNSITRVVELASGRVVAERSEYISWMPASNLYYYTRNGIKGRQLVTVDPANGQERVWIDALPEGSFRIAPTEDFLLYTLVQEGPKDKKEIFEVIVPDDRQPGWRNRVNIAKYDIATGLMQPLTFGYRNVRALDIAPDGSKALISTSRDRLTQRPTSLQSLHLLDLKTLQIETLVEDDGFLAGGGFSPDGTQIYLMGSPEALNGIGKNVKEGQTPNMYDYQLYIMNLADKKIRPMTRDFNPAVQSVVWSKYDNRIYFNAENLDFISLYCMNPKNGKIEQIDVEEDMINDFTVADSAPVLAYYGQGASNSDRLYIMDLKKKSHTLHTDLSAKTLKNVELGECHEWNFTNSRGDLIYGRYYLPPHFDASKKYPMIVNYYGGCSPTSRNFESRYPHHAYAALGYVVYVVEPSGATGFGQEFSARHVNTAGEGPAQDIIEGTEKFCQEHSFVNADKIGCIGASYGGFMTMYLQTKTDIFAAAISHAGISDHTSYWGEGYWGYSYSEVSMANSYPWTSKELYVDRSPLFNADKINTPILFLHGNADTNVPVGESIQMFTALKLLGRETAMVLVDEQDHHITEYNKRLQWQNTIYAWFAKWLQDDDSWWNAIYSPKSL